MGKGSSFSNGDGTSSKIDSNVTSRNNESSQDNKYTFNDSDKGKSDMSKEHQFVERNYSKGTVKEGGRGANYNSSSSSDSSNSGK